jgi:CRP/FNR family transcriptional regulator, cyclic AMP receptor protein
MVSLSLFRSADTQEFAPGHTIFDSGEDGGTMYVLTEGEVEIRVGDVVAEVVTPGGIFGEMALIDKSPRSATAKAKTLCRVAALDERRFNYMVGQTPYFALEVMSIMANRLRRANARLRGEAS